MVKPQVHSVRCGTACSTGLDLLVFPVVLGGGKRLFSEPYGQVPLTLANSDAFVAHLTYEPAR